REASDQQFYESYQTDRRDSEPHRRARPAARSLCEDYYGGLGGTWSNNFRQRELRRKWKNSGICTLQGLPICYWLGHCRGKVIFSAAIWKKQKASAPSQAEELRASAGSCCMSRGRHLDQCGRVGHPGLVLRGGASISGAG